MKILKPNFWNYKKVIFVPLYLLLMPFAFILQIFDHMKSFLSKPHQEKGLKVICIGNIYLGGTGKTPLSIELGNLFKNKGKKSVIIKKNYKNQYDEMELVKSKNINLIVEDNRVLAIKKASKENYEIAILDDGFQDYSIQKDLNILCFGSQWLGNGFTIPAGPLRQNLNAIKKSKIIVLNSVNEKIIHKIENKIKKIKNDIMIFHSYYEPDIKILKEVKEERVFAFAGIGNPDNFFKLLSRSGLEIYKKIPFPDHYMYSKKDLDKIILEAKNKKCKIITTEKDYFRCKKYGMKEIDYLPVNLIIKEKSKFVNEIEKLIK